MKRIGIIFGILAAVPAAASWFSEARARVAYAQPRSWYEAHVDLAQPERARIRRHLAETEAHMRSNPPAGLTAVQMQNRLARLDDLHEYWTRGEFPQNRDFPDRLIPYFIDAEGVPCAMGHLVIRSGGGAFAEEIRATRNNAYIGEIAAMDGRLAAWGAENGITLDEAARVQPAYGPPRLSTVYQIELDSLGRPWAFGPDANAVGGQALFLRDSSQWKMQGTQNLFAAGVCVSRAGKVLEIASSSEVRWNNKTYFRNNAGYSACNWTASGTDAWVGSRTGLERFRRTGTQDTLVRVRFTTSLASDTVNGVAVSANAVWAGTPRGIYRRGLVGADTAVTVWDSAAMHGKNITGLKSNGETQIWAGIEGAPNGSRTYFSTRGLRRYTGTGSGWMRYIGAMSSVQTPGDTIYALAIRDTASVWVAARGGFLRFNLQTTAKVADIPSGVTVHDMVGNSQGFYAGTSNGVYQFRNDSLVWLGTPAVSLRPGLAAKHPGAQPRLRVHLGWTQPAPGALSLLGRKTGPQAAAGVYVAKPEVEPSR